MFDVLIINPKHTLYEGKGEVVSLPGEKGVFEILDHHAPIITLLGEGKIIIDEQVYLLIEGGLAKFYNNKLTVLTEK
ncbi:MAG: hypothetical protein ABIK26_00875 [Candidatus Omnitrophota bacterium]